MRGSARVLLLALAVGVIGLGALAFIAQRYRAMMPEGAATRSAASSLEDPAELERAIGAVLRVWQGMQEFFDRDNHRQRALAMFDKETGEMREVLPMGRATDLAEFLTQLRIMRSQILQQAEMDFETYKLVRDEMRRFAAGEAVEERYREALERHREAIERSALGRLEYFDPDEQPPAS